MRKLAFLVAGAVGSVFWLAVSTGPVSADNGPHVPTGGNLTVDRCAACHRTHTAKAEYILKESQPALCYTCHGAAAGGATTDVLDGVGYTGFERGAGGQPLRGGGFAYALIGSGSASRSAPGVTPAFKTVPLLTEGVATTSQHSVDGSEGTAWGNGAISATANAGTSVSLRCASCHDPHGNGNYRILRPIPEESGATTGVSIPDSTAKVYTTSNYWATDDANSPIVSTPITVTSSSGVVTQYRPTEFIANISAWCTTCHTRYLAPRASYKTDSGDAVFMYRHRSDQNYKEGGANCITCHVAHGSNASMNGLNSGQAPQPDGTGPTGSSKLLRVDNRGTCNMCHNV